MIKTPLRFFERSPEELFWMGSTDQTSSPTKTISGEAVDQDLIRKSQGSPILSDPLKNSISDALILPHHLIHGVFH